MILILAFVYYLSHSGIHAAPVSNFESCDAQASTLALVSPPQCLCICPNQQRSIWDILWSCLATIFACSWVSVHPNIPAPKETWWRNALRRIELMFCALIAPEMIILWASRQWYAARALAKQYRAQGWKKTHGYFIQMGGFALFEAGQFRGVLSPERMEDLLRQGKIDFPTITEEEIQDRSKGDGLSKALVIFQTSWFVVQCVARSAQGLIITELELVTLAFAVLNGVMYFLWWNKPLDVRCSIPICLLDTPKEPFKFEPQAAEPLSFTLRSVIFSLIETVCDGFFVCRNLLAYVWKVVKTKGVGMLKRFVVAPWTPILFMYSIFLDMVHVDSVEEGQAHVSTFYAGRSSYAPLILGAIVGIIFGIIHCAGWVLSFPSHAELLLWRVASAVTVAIPLSMVLTMPLTNGKLGSEIAKFKRLAQLREFLLIIPIPLYMIARLALLVEALVTLRDLPQGAYGTINWITIIPHCERSEQSLTKGGWPGQTNTN